MHDITSANRLSGTVTINKLIAVAVLLSIWTSCALAADASERKFIRQGMSEGEVLMKIGKPDSESVESGGGAQTNVKQWIYFPDPRDEQTLTTITLKNGSVTAVKRTISR